ncbi:MAG: YceI family protein [Candidatus Dormibacteraeota bacterium]|nr:YceI family protein [Candidatus Dormibacteraeota bacterium]
MAPNPSGSRPREAQAVAAWLTDASNTGRWVVDPSATRASFQVKHFWGAMTVKGSLAGAAGEIVIGSDGSVSGQVTLQATSLDTKNAKRDAHLRSADFFKAADHPEVALSLTSVRPTGERTLGCSALLTAAGVGTPVEFNATVDRPNAQSISLTAEITLDRTKLSMTWSPMGMASRTVITTVTARFVRPREGASPA